MDKKRLGIGAVIRRERQVQGISLDEASRRTGVSKAMLGQIERDESSPTLSTVWKISSGLRIPLSTLLTPSAEVEYHVTKFSDLNFIEENNGGIRVYTIFPFNPVAAFDYLYILQEPNNYYQSTTHLNAKEEYVVVTSGVLTMHIRDKTYVLGVGDSISFAGDETHAYENTGTETAIYQSIVRY